MREGNLSGVSRKCRSGKGLSVIGGWNWRESKILWGEESSSIKGQTIVKAIHD